MSDFHVNGDDHHEALAREKSLAILAAMSKQVPEDDWVRRTLLPTIGRFVSAQVKPLKDEIVALKLQIAEIQDHGFKYAGVWQKAIGYPKGTVVTFDGAMHVAVKDTQPAQAPLTCDAWQLCVKAGRDAPRLQTPRRS